MAIRQLSVFVANEPGSLSVITDALAAAGVDLRAMSIADTADFGILRLIVDQTDTAAAVLKKLGTIYSVTEVVAAAIDDRPGGLADVLRLLSENGINVEYLYAFIAVSGREAFLVLRVDDNEKTERILTEHQVKMLGEADIHRL